MSKMDGLRAMREARYERSLALARLQEQAPAAPKTRKTALAATVRTTPPREVGAPDDGLCGHRSMNGRTCTREQGHEAKTHRYS
jgi:hypothetical protein